MTAHGNDHGGAVTIIGSGLAGIGLARELRKRDPALALRILCRDAADFYSKPTLSNALARGKSPEQLVLTPRGRLAEELCAEILPHTDVSAIDATGQRLATSAGPLAYERLVLATGAGQPRLAIPGAVADEVLTVNALDDYARMRERLQHARTVVLIGAGLIGCEFANDLRLGGFQVTVLDLAAQPLSRLLPPACGAWLRERLEAAGVVFRLGRGAARLEGEAGQRQLIDSTGEAHPADLVLSMTGLQPDLTLARAAGLRTARGILVDRQLRTSAENIYALGDGVETAGLHLPYVAPIALQAAALAATLTGTPTPLSYPALPVMVKTPACPAVVCPPPSGVNGEWVEELAAESAKALFMAAGELRGFALLGKAVTERAALCARLPALLA